LVTCARLCRDGSPKIWPCLATTLHMNGITIARLASGVAAEYCFATGSISPLSLRLK
jgi:hypothetical protein